MRLHTALAALAFAFLSLAPFAARAGDTASSPAAKFVQELGDTALVSLTDKNLPRAEREARTRKLLRSYFDVDTIARFALGTYWREATDTQKREYLQLFERMIVETYTTRFEEYSGQSFQVDNAIESGKSDSIVSSRILQKDGPPVNVEWRVRSKDGGTKIIDVVVENISMSVTQRSDFAAVISRGGGKIDALLDTLRKKEATAKKG